MNRYVRGLLEVPLLARMVERETAEGVDLTTGATIEVHTASLRSVRGYAAACIVADAIHANFSLRPPRPVD